MCVQEIEHYFEVWSAKTEMISTYTGVQEQILTSAVKGVGLVCMECAQWIFVK
jgi:hypothetical protein